MIKKSFLILLSVIFILASFSFGVFASPIEPENTTEEITVSAEVTTSAETSEGTTVSDEASSNEETTAVAEETTAGEDAVTDEATTVENTDKAGLSISKLEIILYACVAAAAVLVILIVVLIVMLIKLKKKKKETGDKPRKVKAVDGKSGGSVAPVASAPVKKSVSVNIPEGTPEAIAAVFGLEQSEAPANTGCASNETSNEASASEAAPAIQETSLDEIQAQLMKLYDGTMKPSEFTEKTDALLIKNLYELNISSSIAPVFETTENISSARFVVVAGKYLYINFHSYSKSDFKLYSDLEGVDRCFDINMSGNRVPFGSAIKSISPAKVELVNNTYTLTEKGKIVVEL